MRFVCYFPEEEDDSKFVVEAENCDSFLARIMEKKWEEGCQVVFSTSVRNLVLLDEESFNSYLLDYQSSELHPVKIFLNSVPPAPAHGEKKAEKRAPQHNEGGGSAAGTRGESRADVAGSASESSAKDPGCGRTVFCTLVEGNKVSVGGKDIKNVLLDFFCRVNFLFIRRNKIA